MSLVNDSEKLRWICRIMAIAFRIAKDQPAGTISRSWVARYLKRSEDFVKRNWNRDPFEYLLKWQRACLRKARKSSPSHLLERKKVSIGFKRRLNGFEGRKRVLQASTGFFTPLMLRLFIRFQRQSCRRKIWRIACGFVSL